MFKISAVQNQIFNAYIIAGRKWPQLQWASNILVMNQLFIDQKRVIQDLNNFLQSELSIKQLSILKGEMSRHYRNYNIGKKEELTISMLTQLWVKAKIGVHSTVMSIETGCPLEFFTQTDQIDIQAYQYMIKSPVFLSPQKITKSKTVFSIVTESIKKNKNLSKLYRHSYNCLPFKLEDEMGQILKQKNMQKTDEFMDCNMFTQNRTKLREKVIQLQFDQIQKQLMRQFKVQIEWAVYDNVWVDKMKIKK